jgi:glycosyltransferase involved in cell wall biosynthesis
MSKRAPAKIQALISTIEPVDGGVPSMTRWICKLLEELDINPVLAWYAPWRNYPLLSVPFYKCFRGARPRTLHQIAFERYESYGIGSWLPELEFTHYLPSPSWNKLLDDCDLHLAVSGNALCALPYLRSQIPFLAWIATPWEADRKDRISKFSFPRRILDTALNTPILKNFEKKILDAPKGKIICLSNYTLREVNHLSSTKKSGVLYMSVDTNLFQPDFRKIKPWRIGFSGRYCDPRKNIELLLLAAKLLLDWNCMIELVLVGDKDLDQISNLIHGYRLEQSTICYAHMAPADLSSLLQTFDIFVIPSHQEGLCIAALEAMACGVPVISTRCGGPEDFVLPGITGELVDKKAETLALTIKSLCLNREKRHKMGVAAVNWINIHASENASRKSFQTHFMSFAHQKGVRIG